MRFLDHECIIKETVFPKIKQKGKSVTTKKGPPNEIVGGL